VSRLLDPQQNLLTVLLVALISALIVLLVAQMLWLGRVKVERIPAQGQTEVSPVTVEAPQTGLADLGNYSTIIDRPVFFSDRRLPVVELPDENAEDQEVVVEFNQEQAVNDLQARVAGIVITPEMSLALVRDQAAKQTLVLREGMSLEGEQAAWRLDSIAPRAVNFVSVDGRESLLELAINTSGLKAGSSGIEQQPPGQASARDGRPQQPPAEPGELTDEQAEARARAEEVRRRVAERRAELRAEAERRAKLQQERQDDQ